MPRLMTRSGWRRWAGPNASAEMSASTTASRGSVSSRSLATRQKRSRMVSTGVLLSGRLERRVRAGGGRDDGDDRVRTARVRRAQRGGQPVVVPAVDALGGPALHGEPGPDAARPAPGGAVVVDDHHGEP